MSLFRACLQASSIYTRAQVQCTSVLGRGMANDSIPAKKESSEIVAPEPVREVLVADVISGAPGELRHRSVRIYQPTRNTMQSGAGKTGCWRLDFDILSGGSRWENPLMGWASSADYMQGTRLSFRSKEDAIHFAEKQGWDYYVQPEPVKSIPPKNYAENFVYKPHKLRIMRTK
ncbi:ndufs4 NADH dehydrogenase Fe-S protein subunit [Leucoagaricus gongylophorus]